jgi:hypothetical protein
MLSRDVEVLVVFPHERFVLLGILEIRCRRQSVGLGVPTFIGRRRRGRENQCSTIKPSSNLKISKKTP